ncbi:MAG: hypothetical protein GVY18_12180 [Bacteroidetes bacterium]|jgi:hypothetical protein|nr:hypothetical protein [Bacteroidota bacterium]
MEAIEFRAAIRGGVIEIPEEYRERLTGRVRVLVLSDDEDDASEDLIGRLLDAPRHIEHFTPMRRDDLYERT